MLTIKDLHDYQIFAIRQYLDSGIHKQCLFLDMGLGKTVITYSIIAELIEQCKIGSALVICPATCVQSVWCAEAGMWNHLQHLKVVGLDCPANERIQLLQEHADVYVISRDNIHWLFDKDIPCDMLVLDEATSFKNRSTRRWASLCQKSIKIGSKKLKRPASIVQQMEYIIALSGTPCSESYAGLWAILACLNLPVHPLAKNITEYRQKYMVAQDYNGFPVYNQMQDGAIDIINKKIKNICISMKSEDYLNLPDRLDILRYTNAISKEYLSMDRFGVVDVGGTVITAGDTLTKYNKMLQILSGKIYDEYGDLHSINNIKLDALAEIVDTTDEPILIAYKYNFEKDEIIKKIKGTALDSPDKIKMWNEGKIKVGLIYPGSQGRGLNLASGGSIILWYTLPLSLEDYLQTNKRLHRQGQKHTVRILHLINKGSIDEKIYKLLKAKKQVLDGLMEYMKV